MPRRPEEGLHSNSAETIPARPFERRYTVERHYHVPPRTVYLTQQTIEIVYRFVNTISAGKKAKLMLDVHDVKVCQQFPEPLIICRELTSRQEALGIAVDWDNFGPVTNSLEGLEYNSP